MSSSGEDDDDGAGERRADEHGDNIALSSTSVVVAISSDADAGLGIVGVLLSSSFPPGDDTSPREPLLTPSPWTSFSTGDAPGGLDATGDAESKVRRGCLPANPTGEPVNGWSTGLVAMETCGLVGKVPRSGESVGVCGE